MTLRSLRTVAFAIATFSWGACSSDTNALIDTAPPVDDFVVDVADNDVPDVPTVDIVDVGTRTDIVDAADSIDHLDAADITDVVDVMDITDVLDARGVRDAPDAGDMVDVADAGDMRDTPDTVDVRDVADAGDVRDATDAIDAVDVRDVAGDVRDAADAVDVRDVADAGDVRDVADAGDVRDAPDATDAPCTGSTPVLCAGACVDTRSNLTHCGACNVVCPGTDSECRRRTCTAGTCGFSDTTAGTRVMVQSAGDCRVNTCDGRGNVTATPDDGDIPVDGNPCTLDRCMSGVPSNPPQPMGTPCGAMGMFCNGSGVCVECVRPSDCASGVCTSGRCQSPTCSDGVRNGAEAGIDCGGPCPACPVLVAFASGTSGALGATFDIDTRTWATTVLSGGRSVDGVSVAVTTTGDAVAMVRFTQLGDLMDNRLRYTVHRSGTWRALADVGPTVTTQGAPSVVASPSGGVWATFHGFDFNHYFAAFDGTSWTPPAEPTGVSGARAGAIARNGTHPLTVFARGLANELASRERVAATWGRDLRLDTTMGFDFNVSPTLVNLSATHVVALWVAPGGVLRTSVFNGATWGTPLTMPLALSSTRVAATRTSDTELALAFRGTDGNLYVATTDGVTASRPQLVANAVLSAPAIARGVAGASLELVYLDAAGRIMHTRNLAGTWTTPALVGGAGLAHVALASGP